eukprot:scaffold18229_cov73-Cyclotella_meneghiniana.AAC.10
MQHDNDKHHPHPCLWRPLGQTSNSDISEIPALTRDEEEREFYRARHISLDKLLKSYDINSSLTVVEPARLSLLEIMSSSLALGQKVALATFLLVVARKKDALASVANGELSIATIYPVLRLARARKKIIEISAICSPRKISIVRYFHLRNI